MVTPSMLLKNLYKSCRGGSSIGPKGPGPPPSSTYKLSSIICSVALSPNLPAPCVFVSRLAILVLFTTRSCSIHTVHNKRRSIKGCDQHFGGRGLKFFACGPSPLHKLDPPLSNGIPVACTVHIECCRLILCSSC